MRQSRPARLTALLLVILLAGACRTDARDGGGSVVVGTPADADALLPPLFNGVQGRVVTELLFDRLADLGAGLNVVGDAGFEPRLATSWTWSADSLAIDFLLAPDATWHDGRAVRAADVRFGFQVIREPANASPLVAVVANIDSVVVLDSLRVRMHFARRVAEQFYHATRVVPLPAHRLAAIPAGDSLRRSAEATAPVGSGRFKFVAWTPQERMELAAVDGHYRGRPAIDRVLFVITPPAAGLARVWAAETDVWEPLPPNAVADAAPHAHVRLAQGPGFDYMFLAFNLRDPRDARRPHPLFGDRALRRALTSAVDRDAVRRATFDSLAVTSRGPFVRAQQTADTSLAQIPFDSAAAALAFDSLGFRRGPDGVRTRGGRRLAFAVLVPTTSAARMRAATVIQEQLRQAGVEMTIRALEIQAMMEERSAGRFDAAMWGWRTTPSQSAIRGTWGSQALSGSRQNVSTYASAAFDSAVVAGERALDLPAQRAAYRLAFQTIIEDAPAIWLFEANNLAAVHRRLQVPAWRSDAWWMTLGEWSVDPAQRLPRDARPATP